MTVEALQVPVYRPFAVRVARVHRLSPCFLRVTFTGPEMADFTSNGRDQRIKVLLPLPGRGIADCPPEHDWYGSWRALPDERRMPMRTYTIRALRPELGEVDVDFVLHGATGRPRRGPRRPRSATRSSSSGPTRGSPARRAGSSGTHRPTRPAC